MPPRGKKLSDAYVELRADDSKLSGDVKVKATRAAKGFGSQLNNALKALSIDPIDVKASPEAALAAIETTRDRLREMSREADSVEMRVRTERAITQLDRFAKQLGAVGDTPVKVQADVSPAARQVEQLQRRLSALGIDPPVVIDADPKTALAALKRVDGQLQELSKDASSVQVRMDVESARGDLDKLRQRVTAVGDEGAEGFAARFLARVGPLMASMPLSGPMLAAVGVAAAVAAPTLAAAMGAAMIGGAAGTGIVGGAVLAARDPRVKAAGADLGAFILGDLEARAGDFAPEMLGAIARIRSEWGEMGGDLDRIFAASRFVDPLVEGALAGARQVVGGIADAVEEADPVIASMAASFDRLGDSIGDQFSLLAGDADEAASAVDDLTQSVDQLIRVTGGLIHAGLVVKGWADEVDNAVDRGRYWIEDSSYLAEKLRAVGIELDITADGFKKGTPQAEAFRKATLGTAEAADFATLKAAGMTDAQIAAADSSGRFRTMTDEVAAALGRSADAMVATEDDVKRLQLEIDTTGARMQAFSQVGQEALQSLLVSSGMLTGAMIRQTTVANTLRQAHEQMFGAAIRGVEANEGYQASWDNLSGSVEQNGRTLNINTKEGRSNRDALQELLGRTNELYYAEIETGTSVEQATKKHNDRVKAIKEEAKRLGLNKTETQKLIDTYGKIPPAKKTDLLLDGLDRIGRALTDLYIFQRSLATGRTLAQVRSDLFGGYAGNPRVFKAEGGPVPGHSPHPTADNIPAMLTANEFVQPVPTVDYYGVAAMEAIRQRRVPKDVLQGYALGGLVGDRLRSRDWGSRMPYEVDLSESRVPSKAEVSRKVIGVPPSSGPTLDFMVRALRAAFPQLELISGYRAGARTLSGNLSYHGMRRAVDYPPNREMAAWVNRNYMARTREFISPFQEYNILNGRRHRYTGAVWNQHNWSGGNAHNHWAMDNGGYLMPGWNPPIYNGTGRPEPVTPAPVMDVVVERLEKLIAAVDRIAPGVGRVINGAASDALTLARVR